MFLLLTSELASWRAGGAAEASSLLQVTGTFWGCGTAGEPAEPGLPNGDGAGGGRGSAWAPAAACRGPRRRQRRRQVHGNRGPAARPGGAGGGAGPPVCSRDSAVLGAVCCGACWRRGALRTRHPDPGPSQVKKTLKKEIK